MGKYVELKNRIKRDRKEKVYKWIKENSFLTGLFGIFFILAIYCLILELLIIF